MKQFPVCLWFFNYEALFKTIKKEPAHLSETNLHMQNAIYILMKYAGNASKYTVHRCTQMGIPHVSEKYIFQMEYPFIS